MATSNGQRAAPGIMSPGYQQQGPAPMRPSVLGNPDVRLQPYLAPLGAVDGTGSSVLSVAYSLASVAGATTGAYHGYRRNNGSVGWAIGWFVFGGLLPFLSIPISLAEGFGKPAAK